MPVIPFGDVVANAGGVDPTQSDNVAGKFGATLGVMVTVKL